MQPSALYGPGFAAALPPGFVAQQVHPLGGYIVLPPGSTPPPVSPAMIVLEAVHPMMAQGFLQGLYSMDNPIAAMMQGMSLGLSQVYNIAPARQTMLGSSVAHIREIDAVSGSSGQPLRLMLLLLFGSMGMAKVIIGINIYRWQEFIGHCLRFVGGINLNGQQPAALPQVQAVVDERRTDQIEFRVRSAENKWEPITALPTHFHGTVIINHVDQSTRISGVGNVMGNHSTSKVSA